jgi:hypothetical protein
MPDGDIKEGTHDVWVELGTGTGGQFGASCLRAHRPLVAADAGHGVVAVGHGHDPAPEGDLISRQPVRVTGAVVPLVVLGNGACPLPQPTGQRCSQLGPFERMVLHDHPLVVIELVRLVQDMRVNGQLADVVEKG